MRSGRQTSRRRATWSAATMVLALAAPTLAGAARAECSPAAPLCWAERIDAACAAAPTRACVTDLRLDLLDRLMTAHPDEARDLFFSQSFELAIASPDAATRRRIAALGERHGFQPNRFGVAVKLFAEDRFDWRTPLARGDVAGAIAAIPDPTLSVSYQWLDGTVDAIFREAVRRGRGGEVLEAIASGRIDGDNWRSQRDGLFDRWFRAVMRGDPVLVERLIGLAAPERARSMRLARAATAADPAALAAAFAAAFPRAPGPGDDVEEDTRSVWRAYEFLAAEPVATRERFLDAMPRFVSAEWTGQSGAPLDGPVGRGEVGIVRRLVARTLPDDEASGLYRHEAGMTSAAIERTIAVLDPPDRRAATGMEIEALIAEGAWDRAVKLANTPDAIERLTGPASDAAQARGIAMALITAGHGKRIRALLAAFDGDTVREMLDDAGRRAGARKLLELLAADPQRLTRGTPFAEVDDRILKDAWDLAQTRGDCRGLLTVARNRHDERSALDLARDLGWVSSCLATREETSR